MLQRYAQNLKNVRTIITGLILLFTRKKILKTFRLSFNFLLHDNFTLNKIINFRHLLYSITCRGFMAQTKFRFKIVFVY